MDSLLNGTLLTSNLFCFPDIDRYDIELRRIAAEFLWIASFGRADRNTMVRHRRMFVKYLLSLLDENNDDITNDQLMAIIMLVGTAAAVDVSGPFVVTSLQILNRWDSNTNSYLGCNNLASLLRYLQYRLPIWPISDDSSAQAEAGLDSQRMIEYFRAWMPWTTIRKRSLLQCPPAWRG
jgi:hypothetical protein